MINMNEVLDGFLGKIAQFKIEINQILTTLNNKTTQLANDRIALETKETSLKAREAEVQKIEDIIALKTEAKDLLKEATIEKTALSTERDSFENYKNKTLGELRTLESELEQKGNYIKAEYEALQKAQKAHELDKETYKEKIAKGIVDIANKK